MKGNGPWPILMRYSGILLEETRKIRKPFTEDIPGDRLTNFLRGIRNPYTRNINQKRFSCDILVQHTNIQLN